MPKHTIVSDVKGRRAFTFAQFGVPVAFPKDSSGGVSVYDSELNRVEYFSAEDVTTFKGKHL